jgi:hypothetical protein
LDLTTHTSLSPIRRGFAPGFVNYKKGCTRLAAAVQVIKFTSCLPMVGGLYFSVGHCFCLSFELRLLITTLISSKLFFLKVSRHLHMVGFFNGLFEHDQYNRWFSPGTPASSTTKTGRHDIAEILLKVALKHQKSISQSNMLSRALLEWLYWSCHDFTPKNHIFPILGCAPPLPPWIRP